MKFLPEILGQLHISKLTPIQGSCFKLLENRLQSLTIVSKTGTGKTYAYGLYLVNQIFTQHRSFAIILPTNELIMQAKEVFFQLLSIFSTFYPDVKTEKLVLGGSTGIQEVLSKGKNRIYDLIISTPEKLVKLLDAGLNLRYLETLIFDEADMMFTNDFILDLEKLIRSLHPEYHFIVSATINQNLRKQINQWFGPTLIVNETKSDSLAIDYRVYRYQPNQLDQTLIKLMKNLHPYLCLIFVSKMLTASKVATTLKEAGFEVAFYSSFLSIQARKNLFAQMQKQKFPYIVTTDLLARGIDLEVSDIINYDFPHDQQLLTHRFGRTGRAGHKGTVHLLVHHDSTDNAILDKLKTQGYNWEEYRIEDFRLIPKTTPRPKNAQLTEAIKKIPLGHKVEPNYRKKRQDEIHVLKKRLNQEKFKKIAKGNR
jgi:ATP-dependent RNA helicase CshB